MVTKKAGWGTGIAMLYGGFVVLILLLVTGSMRQRFDLVSKDYYEQELQYQQVIDAGRNQAALSEPVLMRLDGDRVVLVFPRECAEEGIAGKVFFYAPVNRQWDRTIPIETSQREMAIDRADLHAANYTVKISWSSGGKEYYQESPLNLYQP
jgi:nitrogen fixation protein FixH